MAKMQRYKYVYLRKKNIVHQKDFKNVLLLCIKYKCLFSKKKYFSPDILIFLLNTT